MSKKCKVVLIDTGIELKNRLLSKISIKGVRIKKDKNGYIVESDIENQEGINDKIGHGTAVSGIILAHNPEVEFFVVKLFDWNALNADTELLCYALEYIINNVEFDIINMSLGVCVVDNQNKLYSLCNQIKERNKVIVSAFDNNGSISYPAAYDCVVGVTSGEGCRKINDIISVENEMVNYCAKGGIQRINWLNNNILLGMGNSYACAHITGILSKCVFETFDDAIKKLDGLSKERIFIEASNTNSYERNNCDIKSYKKAVVFPFNKEVHSLVRFSSMLSFELIDVYDTKYSGHVGASTITLLNNKEINVNYIIKSIDEIDWDTFDTFILGHVREYFEIINYSEYINLLIKKIISKGKKIYAFDDLSIYNITDINKQNIYYPQLTNKDVTKPPFGKLFRQEKPVLGIFGTSSKQGKFTLQLKIRAELMRMGYKISQIGTEPSSLLYGMDVVFPTGYNSSVYFERKDTIAYINEKMHCLAEDTDLFIVGGQSGVVIRDEGNLDNYNFIQIDFLYATLPDIVVLCVNINDEDEIIERTIKFIEGAVGCKVVALVAYPIFYEEEDVYKQRKVEINVDQFSSYKKKLEKEFDLPVFLLSNSVDIDMLVSTIINSFSEN